MGWSEYTFLELCMWPTRAKGDTRRFKAPETKYKVCFTTCMEPYPSYMFYFIENLWEFMGYWTSSYYGQWISLSNWKLGVWTSPWMQSVFNEPCKEIGFNSMDQESWKAVAWKVSENRLRQWFSKRIELSEEFVLAVFRGNMFQM